ncbi:lipase [Rhizoctonia solani 123E]|uniref:sn-1-specific diacylglycerol lipase n=1 Tax=Rhizoctonia solani 123E TaxID=1423351 RepID=A0A074RPL6_9AGAM|nr:lipase [Rhizoctonia solani 123E]
MAQSQDQSHRERVESTPAWQWISNMGLAAASVTTSFGFAAVTRGTQMGFGIARGITSAIAYNSAALAEEVVFGRQVGAAATIGSAINTAFGIAESLALAPIQLGHNIASTSLVAAASSLDLLVWMFGTKEVGFSLVEFGTLVQREWSNPPDAESLPPERYGPASIVRALVAWAVLQDATSNWGMQRCIRNAREISMAEWKGEMQIQDSPGTVHEPLGEDFEIIVTANEELPDDGGILVEAQISHFRPPGAYAWVEVEEEPLSGPLSGPSTPSRSDNLLSASTLPSPPKSVVDWAHLRPTLRRMSHLVVGGYGGASFLFFGLTFPSTGESDIPTMVDTGSSENGQNISRIVQEAESEARVPPSRSPEPRRTWWGLITGQHDQEIFERFAADGAGRIEGEANTAILGDASRLPRFWVLTDHGRKQIVLVLRGTYSLNELAIDLTCNPVPFTPARETPTFRSRDDSEKQNVDTEDETHIVHGGMLKTAELMGLPGKPVHTAIAKALRKHPGYALVLTGHSLGAGIASLLSLMWADASTGLTVRRSGLPSHRSVTVYCFGPPCIMSPQLSKLAKSMVTSFIYSHDIVSTLSLGSVRDMQRAAAWLCVGSGEESCSSILSKATRHKFGRQGEDEEAEATAKWLLASRKTLEANMNMADLFPPGRVLWALNDCDVSQITGNSSPADTQPGVLRLFEVDQVETAFSQIVFSRDMLSSHLPHNYNRVIQELL